MNVMNAYFDNVFSCEDDNSTPKENIPPPIPVH